MCQEYVVQGDDVLFHLRPKDTKHTVLFPVGKEVALPHRRRPILSPPGTGGKKEHEYLVVAIESRGRAGSAVQTAMKVNHLQ